VAISHWRGVESAGIKTKETHRDKGDEGDFFEIICIPDPFYPLYPCEILIFLSSESLST
jgi:hypothetical protein